jgi:predicted Rossmann-fold nucleotide-binding protein
MNFIYQKVYKKNMTKGECDICIILPGGIGTLYEMLEMIYYEKPILIYNIDGFYTSFIDFIDELKTLGFIDRELNIHVFNNINEINKYIN